MRSRLTVPKTFGTLHVAGRVLVDHQTCALCGRVLVARGHVTGKLLGTFTTGQRIALTVLEGEGEVCWPYTETPKIGTWEVCT